VAGTAARHAEADVARDRRHDPHPVRPRARVVRSAIAIRAMSAWRRRMASHCCSSPASVCTSSPGCRERDRSTPR
jgi:hypothetical protein